MDPQSLSLLFKAPDILKSVASMLGIVESIDCKVDKLLQNDYNAGVRCLKELQTSNKEREFLLKEGWRRFHGALNNESGIRKALSYIGLSFCQYHLGEHATAMHTLQDFLQWDYVDQGERTKRAAIEITGVTVGSWALAGAVVGAIFLAPYAAVLGLVRGAKLKDDAVKLKSGIIATYNLYSEYWSKIESEEVIAELKKGARDFIQQEMNAN